MRSLTFAEMGNLHYPEEKLNNRENGNPVLKVRIGIDESNIMLLFILFIIKVKPVLN